MGGYGTGRQRKLALLQLVRDAKASRVEFANGNEPAATTSSSSTMPGASENGTQCKFNSDISYVHYDSAYDSDLYTFVFYPNIVSLCGITITV